MHWYKLQILIVVNLIFLSPLNALETLSYSGRLVQANGSPVTGPVTIRAELAYTNALTTVLCTEDIPNVTLTKGVFHVKLSLDCTASGLTLTQVLSQVPTGESVAIQISDVTNSKNYNFQAMHAIPYANVASQLVQMGATNNQVLKWNNTNKKWEPGSIAGAGTVTNVTATAPLAVTNGSTTPALTISQATTSTNGYLSSTDWNTFNNKQPLITAGTNTQYYRGDKSFQTLDTLAVSENTNLYFTNARALGVPLTGFVTTDTSAIVPADSVLVAFGKAQGQINTTNSSLSNTLIKNNTDTITGQVTIHASTGSLKIPTTPSGVDLTDAANVQYVKNYVDANGKWLKGTGANANDVYYSAGNVGIGTATPTANLHINGSTRFDGGGVWSVYGGGISYSSTSSSTAIPGGAGTAFAATNYGQFTNAFSGMSIETTASGPLFQKAYIGAISSATGTTPSIVIGQQTGSTAYAERVRIDTSGNVGIGTAAPNNALEVNGNLKFGTSVYNSTDLTVGAGAADTSITVTSTTGYPSSGTLQIDSELMTYTGKTATTFTGLTRGVLGTTAATHGAATYRMVRNYMVIGANDSTSLPLRIGGDGTFAVPGSSISGLYAPTALGRNNTVSGNTGTALGDSNTASGDRSTVMGNGNTASGAYSTAIGSYSSATGSFSIVAGKSNTASGYASLAVGESTKAEAYGVVSLGRFNVGGGTGATWVDTDPLFEIGIGTSAAAKANAVTVLKNGNVGVGTTVPVAKLDVAGEIKLGNTSSTCNSTNEGQLRYNSTTKVMEFCNATAWTSMSGGSADGLGYGQTWQSVARAFSTTYTNSSGKPIMVRVYFNAAGAGTFGVFPTVNGQSLGGQIWATSTAGYAGTDTFVVPVGATYSVAPSSSTLTGWYEMR